MKALLIITVLVVSFQLASAQLGPGDHQLSIDGRPEGKRTFYVHVPQKYSTLPNNVALVFAWHGFTEQCARFNYTRWSNVSESEGFIVAYPCGTGNSWNAGVCCGGNRNDDVEFARLMVLKLKELLPKINTDRVFSSGFSNGGMMSEQLACRSSHIFRAIASVAGTIVLRPGNDAGLNECDKFYANTTRRIPILLIHGTLDVVVPYTGNAILGFPDIAKNFARWAQRNKCTGEPVETFKQGVFHNKVYQNCPAGPVELLIQDGGAHVWPITRDVSSAVYAWKWFSQF